MGQGTSKPREIKSVWFADFEKELPSLENKVIAVTGCTSGTGFIAARTCARKGAAAVLMLNRKSSRAESAEAAIKDDLARMGGGDAGKKTVVETIECDLQSFGSVKQAAAAIKAKYDAVDVLCNNAGVMALDDVATEDGFDVQVQTNHLSHFLLTHELMPLLERAAELRGEARVVNHTSLARNGASLDAKYFEKNSGGNLGGNGSFLFTGAKWERYHQTKLANMVFTMGLRDLLAEKGSKVIAAVAAPGVAATNLQITTAQSGGMNSIDMMLMNFAQSAEDGTMPLLSACFLPSKNGEFWEPSGFMHMYGKPGVFEPEAVCKNEQARTMLWEKSESACGCKYRD